MAQFAGGVRIFIFLRSCFSCKLQHGFGSEGEGNFLRIISATQHSKETVVMENRVCFAWRRDVDMIQLIDVLCCIPQ